jgi:hypothetical protein
LCATTIILDKIKCGNSFAFLKKGLAPYFSKGQRVKVTKGINPEATH